MSATSDPPDRVPVAELIDLDALGRQGRAPTPSEIRRALPRGWVLAPDGEYAERDARVLFREGWILILGLLTFGSVGLAFLWGAVPRGWRGVGRLAMLAGLVLLIGGVVAPGITRALNRR